MAKHLYSNDLGTRKPTSFCANNALASLKKKIEQEARQYFRESQPNIYLHLRGESLLANSKNNSAISFYFSSLFIITCENIPLSIVLRMFSTVNHVSLSAL